MTIYDELIKLSNDDKYNYPKFDDKLELIREIIRNNVGECFTYPISNDESIYALYKSAYISPFSMFRFTTTVCPYCRHPINGDEITPYCYTCGVKVRIR